MNQKVESVFNGSGFKILQVVVIPIITIFFGYFANSLNSAIEELKDDIERLRERQEEFIVNSSKVEDLEDRLKSLEDEGISLYTTLREKVSELERNINLVEKQVIYNHGKRH